MKTLRVRHELHPSNVALLAHLGYVVEIDETAPPCISFDGGRDAGIRPDGCRACRRIARGAQPKRASRRPVDPAT